MIKVKSLFCTDLYKLNMLRIFFYVFPNLTVRYVFKCRNKGVMYTSSMLKDINESIDYLCTLRFTEEEIEYISRLPWMKGAYGFFEFLRLFKFNRDYIKTELDGSQLKIVAEGPIFIVSYFETFILSIVSEVYYDHTYPNMDFGLAQSKLDHKIELLKEYPIKFSEFGNRRRFSFDWHEQVIKTLSERVPRTCFTGTSDMYFAKKYGLIPQGTMAHEFLCLGQGLKNVTLAESQKYMFQKWADEYRGNLGIALSDNLGIDKFLKDFDLYFAKLFNGIRQDSGDPRVVAEKIIAHYMNLGIDPKSKTIVFSDCLTFEKAIDLYREFKDRINVAFGIGTNLVCDVGIVPLQCVMKLTQVNGNPVAKISDSEGKTMCEDESFINYLKQVIKC